MHIGSFFCNLFHRHKKSFLSTGMELKLAIELHKKNIVYIIVTVSRGTHLGIVQSMKRKFVSIAENTWKIDTDIMICSCFFLAFSGLFEFYYHSRGNNVS